MSVPADPADWPAVRAWRKAERTRLIERRMAAPPDQRRAWSARIEPLLEAAILARGPRAVGVYWPFKAEFDPRGLMQRLAAKGITVALPAVLAPKTAMEFRRWAPGIAMESGVYDIPVPAARDLVRPDVVLAPLVGFDDRRYRLGYGGGYFDITMASLDPRPAAIGVGYELGRLATTYPQPHDVPMAAIVTEAGTF